MIALDRELFLLLNADAGAQRWLLEAGYFLSVHAQWLVPALIVGLALHRWRPLVRPVGAAVLAISLGSLACELIALAWDRPRPFENGLGYQHLAHGPSPSFPSSHATVYAALGIVHDTLETTPTPGFKTPTMLVGSDYVSHLPGSTAIRIE